MRPRNRQRARKLCSRILPALVTLLWQGAAGAAGTAYIETFGDDANPCSRNRPCATIQHGIDLVNTRGRVLVGPGTYEEQITIVYDGLRLISTSGNVTTTIDTRGLSEGDELATPQSSAMAISADNVTVGQKDRGFKILTNFETGISGIGKKIRVEGNSIDSPTFLAEIGIRLVGDNHIVRHNLIRRIGSYGVFLSGVREQASGRNWMVDGNTFESPLVGLMTQSYAPNNRLRNQNNALTKGGFGFVIYHLDASSETMTAQPAATNDRHSNLKIPESVSSSGIEIVGGNPSISDISIESDLPGGDSVSLSETHNARLSGLTLNSEQSPFGTGILLERTVGTTITNSTVFGYGTLLFIIEAAGLQASNNNFVSSANCPIDFRGVTNPSTDLVLKKNFFSFTAGADTSCSAAAPLLEASGELSFQPKFTPN
ncbi:MAG: DUF1565 domain-containing protein [Pseudomonadota bacterium]